ncbi:MAG TPA: acetyl-CoA carboxylase biotin carboxylase subunit, partial [Streptosporangiaceae bacterium]|nr:acetyl-CoA carboxylase biotin carboxylase subunit [Streptosporangiaceae bacterium]
AGSAVPPHYDSLLGKLIASGPDRPAALARLAAALAACRIEGVATNLPLYAALTGDPEFAAGRVDVGYLRRFLDRAQAGPREPAHG